MIVITSRLRWSPFNSTIHYFNPPHIRSIEAEYTSQGELQRVLIFVDDVGTAFTGPDLEPAITALENGLGITIPRRIDPNPYQHESS